MHKHGPRISLQILTGLINSQSIVCGVNNPRFADMKATACSKAQQDIPCSVFMCEKQHCGVFHVLTLQLAALSPSSLVHHFLWNVYRTTDSVEEQQLGPTTQTPRISLGNCCLKASGGMMVAFSGLSRGHHPS